MQDFLCIRSSTKIPICESAFLYSTWSVHHSCCADREGSNHHHLHVGISSGSSETFNVRCSGGSLLPCVRCGLGRGALAGRLPVPGACGSPVGLHVPIVGLQPRPCSSALLAHVSRAAGQTHFCWQLLLHSLAGQKSSSWSISLSGNATPSFVCLCPSSRDPRGEILWGRCSLSTQIQIWPEVFQVVSVFGSYLQDLLWSWGWHTSSSSLFRKAMCLAT